MGGVKLFNIPIQVNASWFFVVTFLAWTLARSYFPSHYPGLHAPVYMAMGITSALLLFASVLLHELGHSVVARAYGIPVSCVTLFVFGGVARIAWGPSRPSIELKVALAGPLVSALISAAALMTSIALPVNGMVSFMSVAIVRYLALVNIALLCFNLLPGFPLDGGRVLRALLWAWTNDRRRSTWIAGTMGIGLGLGLLALGIWALIQRSFIAGVWYVFLGLFLRNAALAGRYQEA
jgi:Zn-dependent protease